MALVDIHVVAHRISGELLQQLEEQGFRSDEVVGGDNRVRMESLLSRKFETVDDSDRAFAETVRLLESAPSFSGYIEQEIMGAKTQISGNGQKGALTFGPISQVVPEGHRVKTCDIHASVVDVSDGLKDELIESGLYYLVLRKPGIGDVTIFTVQTEGLEQGKHLHEQLVSALRSCGRFNGFVKFEVLRNLRNFGVALPPIVPN